MTDLGENLAMRPTPSPISSEKIFIRLHKQEYAAGDVIYGLVYLWVSAPVASQLLKISIQGFEECTFEMWESEPNPDDVKNPIKRRVERHNKRDTIPKFEEQLASYPRGFPLGYFYYPFKYELPQVMPGSFFCKLGESGGLKWNGMVRYIIRAFIDIPGAHHDLWVEEELLIREAKPSISALSKSVMNTQVQSCFCIPRGMIEVSAWLDKNVYRPEEKLTVHYTIRNTSAVDVQYLLIKLVRVIKLSGNEPNRHKPFIQSMSSSSKGLLHGINYDVTTLPHTKDTSTNMQVLFTLSQNGCRHNQSVNRDANTTLTPDSGGQTIYPTTHAYNIKCTYVLDIEVRAKWSASIILTLPILVMHSLDQQWMDWNAPIWSKKCSIVQVPGEYGVTNSEITEHFSGNPGVKI
ncbi:hypothetical protein LOD99_3034 [Oopsacas minuta]|uniref:Arrestin C-terminal-like domain-containing protein n=1 Tax=Oopsacas minuta TaxID=111878 RepID=A0AAV7K0R9_9METZ|nr:hypothetical protein LOD99_3034 [Oopsacas minuta]